MNSYNNPWWPTDSYDNQHSHAVHKHETLFQPQQYQSRQHFYYDYHHHESKQISNVNSSDCSTSNHSVPTDDKPYSIQYCPQCSLDYPDEQMISTDRFCDNSFFRPQSSARNSESSSSGVDIIDDEYTEEHSCDSQFSIYRHQSPASLESRSRSPFYRRVINKSNDQIVSYSNKQRQERPRRRTQRKQFLYEKNLICKKQSSVSFYKHKRPRRSTDRWEHKDEKLKRLFDEYSNENIDKEWNPLSRTDSQELYQYAYIKYQEKSRHH